VMRSVPQRRDVPPGSWANRTAGSASVHRVQRRGRISAETLAWSAARQGQPSAWEVWQTGGRGISANEPGIHRPPRVRSALCSFPHPVNSAGWCLFLDFPLSCY
jgi:hypothetical protein